MVYSSKRGYMSGSVTRLEKYRQCPFKFYAQYGLKLEPRKVRSFGAPEIGTFLHMYTPQRPVSSVDHDVSYKPILMPIDKSSIAILGHNRFLVH